METLLTHAKQNNCKLYVTISQKGKQDKNFIYTAQQYKKMIKRYCTFYNAIITCKSYNDFEHNITLNNGIKFNAILY